METPASERMPAFSFVRGLLCVGLACRRSRYRVRLSSCESPEPVRSAPSAASVEHQLAELTMRLERAGTLGATRSTLNGARHGKKGGADPHTFRGYWRPRQANSPSVAKAHRGTASGCVLPFADRAGNRPVCPFGSQSCRKFAADAIILAPPNKKPPSLLTRVCPWPTCHRASYSGCAVTIFTLLHPAASRAAVAAAACRS